jgi:hypothetical protein
MVQHLLYKALIEMSADRAEFLSRLFSRKRPAGLNERSSAEALFQAYVTAAPDTGLFRKNLAAVVNRLVSHHKFALTGDDTASLRYVYTAFFTGGPELTYSFSGAGPGWYSRRPMPSYAALMMESDGAGTQRSYLATEENFRILKDLQVRNLVVPVVGDFAGEKALRALGEYLRGRGATVTAFYTSNVEQYLFRQGDDWSRFFSNVATLPIDEKSTFVRAVFDYGTWGLRDRSYPPGPRSVTLLCPIADLLRAFNEGQIQTYYDVIRMSQ